MTPSEIEWLKQVSKDFEDHYPEIRARALAARDASAPAQSDQDTAAKPDLG